ncbi:hypothetical protein M5K25_016233 [Dendrobium thyrsiflorum]|uniref:Uncharacterized protein n=1 Tax=Dendrobium thyrsiflorum TaxID=117978 RepID=A0ABD0UIZ3_DENTH
MRNSVLAEVLCLHRGVVKREERVLCLHRGEVKKGSVAVLCHHRGEVKKGRVAVLCRRKEEGFSAITVERMTVESYQLFFSLLLGQSLTKELLKTSRRARIRITYNRACKDEIGSSRMMLVGKQNSEYEFIIILDHRDDQFTIFELIVQDNVSAHHLWRLSSEYVNIVSDSLPSPGSGEKEYRFFAFAERLEKERFSVGGRAVLYNLQGVSTTSFLTYPNDGREPRPFSSSPVTAENRYKSFFTHLVTAENRVLFHLPRYSEIKALRDPGSERKEKVRLSMREKECKGITLLLRDSYTLAPLMALEYRTPRPKKIQDSRVNRIVFLKTGHMKNKCPNLKEEKDKNKPVGKTSNDKKQKISWADLASESSDQELDDEDDRQIVQDDPSLWQPESRFSWRKLEERALSLRRERVELEREKSLGEGVWRGFYTVAPASSHRSTSKSRFVLREVLTKKTTLVSKDQVGNYNIHKVYIKRIVVMFFDEAIQKLSEPFTYALAGTTFVYLLDACHENMQSDGDRDDPGVRLCPLDHSVFILEEEEINSIDESFFHKDTDLNVIQVANDESL